MAHAPAAFRKQKSGQIIKKAEELLDILENSKYGFKWKAPEAIDKLTIAIIALRRAIDEAI